MVGIVLFVNGLHIAFYKLDARSQIIKTGVLQKIMISYFIVLNEGTKWQLFTSEKLALDLVFVSTRNNLVENNL